MNLITRDSLKACLKSTIADMTLEQFAHLFINEVTAIEEFYKLCCGVRAGNTISLLFNPHRLNVVTEAAVERTSAPMSIFQSLSDKGSEDYTEKIDGMARLFLYNLGYGSNNPFYATVQRGYNGVAYVNEFPPFVMRKILEEYAPKKDSVKVLDPCGGWGGRMIGTASFHGMSYTACEPSTQTYDGLCRLGEWLKSLNPSFEFNVQCVPYEDLGMFDHKFDVAVTSPPYYNTEKYCDEPTNSLNRYSTYDEWVKEFYEPLIVDTMIRLTTEGVFILNIGDRKYSLSQDLMRICEEHGYICARIADYLSGNGDAKEKFYCISRTQIKPTKLGGLF